MADVAARENGIVVEWGAGGERGRKGRKTWEGDEKAEMNLG